MKANVTFVDSERPRDALAQLEEKFSLRRLT
jgi:hypothetical protein